MNFYFEGLKNSLVFYGRSSQKEYWYFFLFNFIIRMVLLFIGIVASLPFLNLLYILLTLAAFFAVGIRRMHDIGKSGWFLLIPFYSFILACRPSEYGINQYGPNPEGIGNEEDYYENPFSPKPEAISKQVGTF